ncbi:MAG: HIT family protein [Methanoregula sp.]|jgi:diadenosine tetraphosphate (Ap4A) HIT family hydrolase|nr:HIT family protein [Methanoregula sp.]
MHNNSTCPFCSLFGDDIIVRNTLCYARWDRFPVSKGHLLIIPFRHTPDYFTLTSEEKLALAELIEECKTIVDANFIPDGYNIGYNIGSAAGQTVMHCHCHVIPRYKGDTDNPRGGMRRVVAGRYYKDPMRTNRS